MLYFGYGSNLDSADLARWCHERGLSPIRLARAGIAYLPDRRLAFTHRSETRGGGVLDIPNARGCAVAGVLFRNLSDESFAALDRKEASGHTYRRLERLALTDEGGEVPVFVYEVAPTQRHPFVAPARGYLDVVHRGYAEHGLSTEPLEAAARGLRHAGPINHLFVYGTLRSGGVRHAALPRHGSAAAGRAITAGTLLDLGSYPGLVLDSRNEFVAGELFGLGDPAALFAELDAIEGFHGFGLPTVLYRRTIVRVRRENGGTALAWTYAYAGSRNGARVIASGNWLDRDRP